MAVTPLQINKNQLHRSLLTIALPIGLQGLITQSLNLVDNLMVGRLGELSLAAVGLANQTFFLHLFLSFGITSGCATYFAQFWGIKDIENIKRTLGFCVTITMSAGLIFFIGGFFFTDQILRILTNNLDIIAEGRSFLKILSFSFLTTGFTFPLLAALRVTEQAKIPLKISIVVFTVNTGLGFCLIFGHLGLPALGVKGAAIGTLVARLIELLLVIFVVFIKKNIISGKLSEYISYNKVLAMKIIRNALPTTINEFMWALGMTAYAAAFGRLGVTEYAAIQASNTIKTLFTCAIFSLGDAVLILIGKRLGRGEFDLAYAESKYLIKIGMLLGVFTGGLLILFSRYVLMLFDFSPEGLRYGTIILIIYGCFTWMFVFNAINIVGTLRCGGDTRFAMFAEIMTVWGVGVPIVWISAIYFHIPVYYVILLLQMEDVVKFFILLHRFKSKKWMNNLVSDVHQSH